MKTIRKMVFETNSSSVNSLAIFTGDAFSKWEAGDTYVCDPFYNNDVITASDILTEEEVVKKLKSEGIKVESEKKFYDDISELFYECEYQTYENAHNDYLEWSERSFTSPSGDELVIVQQTGFDG